VTKNRIGCTVRS